METNNVERRIMPVADIELRIVGDKDKPIITGYAAKYNKNSLDMGFIERITAGAFDDAIVKSDVRALKNHDPNLLLGRNTNGTLRLKSDSIGLGFEIDAPNTTTGKDTVEEIRRGDITGCSFAFTVDKEEWKERSDGSFERTIIRVANLFDVGPVTYPAYPDTAVAIRSMDNFKKNTDGLTEKEKQEKQKERERQRRYQRGYDELGRELDRLERLKLADV